MSDDNLKILSVSEHTHKPKPEHKHKHKTKREHKHKTKRELKQDSEPVSDDVSDLNTDQIEIIGKQFNELNTNTKFYKFMYDDLKHYNFEYKIGLNINTEQFDPSTSGKGLYFCCESQCHLYWHLYGTKLASVQIPDDARVHVGQNDFKTDRLIITDIVDFYDVADSFWINNIILNNGYALQFIKDPTNLTTEICGLAVKENPTTLRYVPINLMTEEICVSAVERDGLTLEYTKHLMTYEMCLIAVKQNSLALIHVKKQFITTDIYELTLRDDGLLLQFITEQTEDLCKMAITQNGLALQYVKYQTDEICSIAVQQNGLSLEYVRDQTETVCILAIKQNSLALEYVKDMTNEIYNAVVQQDYFILPRLPEPTGDLFTSMRRNSSLIHLRRGKNGI